MDITTVLLDAGEVIINEAEREQVIAEIITGILSESVPGYSVASYYSDVQEAVRAYCPRVYHYVLWKHSTKNLSVFDDLYTRFRKLLQDRNPRLKLSTGFDVEVQQLASRFAIGIAGQYGREVLALLEESDLLRLFTHRLTQEDFAITKPDPRYFEQIAQRFGVLPKPCLMVGDRIDNDVIPAKQLGMKTVLIRTGLHRNQIPRIPSEIPDVELEGVGGLASAVQQVVGI
jgi:FMN phosphatase YigB (HAD superfamily)